MRRLLVTIAALLAASPGLLGGQGPVGREKTATPGPRAASQQEYADYRAALGAASGVALEQAADAFAVKYPQSELRKYLLSRAMSQYQLENNASGMLAAGGKMLALGGGDFPALVLTTTAVAGKPGPPDRRPS